MKLPWRETPILYGEDAIRFQKEMDNVQPLPKERREEMRRQYEEFIKKVNIKVNF